MSEKLEKFSFTKSTLDLERVDFSDLITTINPIIFDTNFLFVTFDFKVDVISELKKVIGGNYNLFIYEGTLGELESIERKGDKNKKFLPLIVKMLHLYNFKIIKSTANYIDEQILSNLNLNVLVATNDKELRLKIWKKNFKVLYLRQKQYFEIK